MENWAVFSSFSEGKWKEKITLVNSNDTKTAPLSIFPFSKENRGI
jgi:hypothetical protein